jgi:plasmid stabilization system protein ParE
VKKFELARRALADLQEIWEFVSHDSFTAADRLLEEFYSAFQKDCRDAGYWPQAAGSDEPRRIVLDTPFLLDYL